MKGMILGTGEAAKLRQLASKTAKPMVPIGNKPLMEYLVELLQRHQIKELIVNLYNYPEDIRDYFGDGSKWGVHIWYSQESTLTGSAGSLKSVEDFFGDKTFVVLAGGALSDIDVEKLVDFHKRNDATATVGLVTRKNFSKPRLYLADDGATIVKVKKGYFGQSGKQGYGSCGAYVFEPKALKYIPKKRFFDLDGDLTPELFKNNEKICGFIHNGYWLNINTLDNFKKANFDILNKKIDIKLATSVPSKDGVSVGDGTRIHPAVQIRPPVNIGNNCLLRENATIIGPAVIGDNSIIDKNVIFQRTIKWGRGYVGKSSQINGALLGDSTYISSDVEVFEKAIIGAKCIVGPGSKIHRGVRLSPGSIIEKNSEVSFPTGKEERLVQGKKTGV